MRLALQGLAKMATADTLRQFSYAIHATKDTVRTRAGILNNLLLVIVPQNTACPAESGAVGGGAGSVAVDWKW